MRTERKVWEWMGETSSSIYPLAQEVVRSQFEKYFTEQRFYQPTFIANQIAPESISVELYSRRNPYANPLGVKQLLADVAEAGLINSDRKGGYTASDQGINAISTSHQAFYDHTNQINRFPADKMQKLSQILEKLVSSCLKVKLSNQVFCMNTSHNGHIKVESGSLAEVDQHLDDMNAFRDDAHICAWAPSGVDGHTWEVLSFVWNGEANTAEKLVEQLPYRQYLAEDHTESLNDLVGRGWIKTGKEGYLTTAEGQKIRTEAEAATDANFFDPWKVLTDDEVTQMGKYLSALKETNLKIAQENLAE